MKKILALMMILCMILGLVACGDQADPAPITTPEPTPTAAPTPTPEPPEDWTDLVGLWESAWDDAYMIFYEDLTWETVSFEGALLNSGSYELRERDIMVYVDGDTLAFRRDDQGRLCCDSDGTLLGYVCGIDNELFGEFREIMNQRNSYFDQVGCGINYEFGQSCVRMENGACVYTQGGENYGRFPVTVNIDLINFHLGGDGYLEIEFAETVRLDAADYPDFVFGGGYIEFAVDSNIFDYYTGYQFANRYVFGDSDTGDNRFSYEYESLGRTVSIEYSYSSQWELEADNSYVLTKHCFVRMPADYDGLVFGHLEACPDYEGFLFTIDETQGEVRLMDASRTAGAVFCRINNP